MKFTVDICRLLGLRGDGPGDEAQDGAPDPADGGEGSSQATLNGEEGLDVEERTRRRAERRRAKRKRQKERRKMERGERTEGASEQEEEVGGAVSDSEEEFKEDQWAAAPPRNRYASESVPAFTRAENKSNYQLHQGASEEEPEWDVSSAFVAKVASHIKVKGPKSRATPTSRENKENEAQSCQVEVTEHMKRRGESLTVQGIQMFGQGLYSQAVDMFTGAICCDPSDHRFYGNRSHCYWCLEQYSSALSDAQRSIQLAPDWPKGLFRKGCALMGLKRYTEAEKAIKQVLKLDQDCKEASSELLSCRVLQLTELGFGEEQSKQLLEKFTTVQAVVASPEAATLKQTPLQDQSGSCRSLWVGNITLEVTEKDLLDVFKTFGEIESIRVLHERFCAFVNFKNANMAARALEKLQGVELGSSKLVMRYPDRWVQRSLPPIQRTSTGLVPNAAAGSRQCAPIDGDECFYWQTTGCFYGDKCLFRHMPDQQGRNKKP